MQPAQFCWLPLRSEDLADLDRIGNDMHPLFPERLEVIAEKFALFSEGFRRLVDRQGRMAGYAIGYPWRLWSIGPLDTFIGALPDQADCIYVHDVALLPEARGQSLPGLYLNALRRIAVQRGYRHLSLLSVYGTVPAWERYGFTVASRAEVDAAIAPYGHDARYMVADVFITK